MAVFDTDDYSNGGSGGSCLMAAVHTIWWLDVVYLLSYFKLIFSLLDYIPQLYVNYKNQSTKGYSMTGIALDFLGGVMSLAQMFILADNCNDWISTFTDFSKFGLGIITILFDVLYFGQHYYYHLHGKLCKRY
nr:cystinosin homolog [Cherax quadricarinatus]XP_053631523.1 cystinosin homolog [Cherax quadricarinatus]